MKSFFAGLGIGALIGVAFAPKSGAETRREIFEAANERYEGLRDEVSQRYEGLRSEIEPRVAELKGDLSESVDAVRERMASVREQVSGAADQLVDAKDRVVEQAKQKYGEIVGGGLLSILNEWPEARLIEIHGIGPVLASKIIENRPYKKEEDLTEAKILPPSAIDALRKAA